MLSIRRSAAEALIAHARKESPYECCGLLIGQPWLIERAVPAANAKRSETNYLIDPQDHFAAIRAARAEGQAVVGGYHSHPRGPALPSETDLKESAGADFIYVIAAPADRGAWRISAFYLDGGNFIEVPLVPVA
jgi:proteasome lid subunit RPN8/RPN11